MRNPLTAVLCAIGIAIMGLPAAPALAQSSSLQCAPFARQVSGIQLFGEAAGWWDQAAGRYARGRAPRVGSVLVFKASGAMTSGHVAMVSGIVSAREIRVTHANWSVIDGRRGQIERDAMVVDVSDAGDWSLVRVWYAPAGGLGTRAYPTFGFIHPQPMPVQYAQADAPSRAGSLDAIMARVASEARGQRY